MSFPLWKSIWRSRRYRDTALLLLLQFLLGGSAGIYGFAFAAAIGIFQVFLYRRIRKKGFRKWTYAFAYLAGIWLILVFMGFISVMVLPIEKREQERRWNQGKWIFTSEDLGLGPGDEPPYTKEGRSLLGQMQEYESAGTGFSGGEPCLWRIEYKYYSTYSSWLLERLREELLNPPKTRYGDGIRRSFRTEPAGEPKGGTLFKIYDRMTDREGRLLEETPMGYLLENGNSLLYFRFTGESAFSEEKLLESIVIFPR